MSVDCARVVVPPEVYSGAQARPPAPGREPGYLAGPPRSPPPPPGALVVLGDGFRRVMSQPRLLLFVWALAMLTAMAASLPAMVTLGMVLGKRPVAALLARGKADYLFGELLTDHPDLHGAIVSPRRLAACAQRPGGLRKCHPLTFMASFRSPCEGYAKKAQK